ncbi:hypothetical protein QYM36_017514, partial [Artemia franciscana]
KIERLTTQTLNARKALKREKEIFHLHLMIRKQRRPRRQRASNIIAHFKIAFLFAFCFGFIVEIYRMDATTKRTKQLLITAEEIDERFWEGTDEIQEYPEDIRNSLFPSSDDEGSSFNEKE